MKRILFFLSLFFLQITGFAQQGPVYGQYFHSPFLYNPAFGGAELYPSLTLTHQRQLLGIEGAPVGSTLAFDMPVLKNMAVGAKIHTESQGLFTTSSGSISLIYVLHLSDFANLRFGLSGGISNNQLDLSTATETQAAYLSEFATPQTQPQIGFGFLFQHKDFKIGAAFPNMARKNLVLNPYYPQLQLTPLGHIVLTATYRFDMIPTQLALEPAFIFERVNGIQEQRMEGGALMHLKETLWVGAMYQYKAGLSGLLGINIKKNVSFGYAYGLSTHASNVFTNSTHEIQIKIKLGKKIEYREKQRIHLPRFQASAF